MMSTFARLLPCALWATAVRRLHDFFLLAFKNVVKGCLGPCLQIWGLSILKARLLCQRRDKFASRYLLVNRIYNDQTLGQSKLELGLRLDGRLCLKLALHWKEFVVVNSNEDFKFKVLMHHSESKFWNGRLSMNLEYQLTDNLDINAWSHIRIERFLDCYNNTNVRVDRVEKRVESYMINPCCMSNCCQDRMHMRCKASLLYI